MLQNKLKKYYVIFAILILFSLLACNFILRYLNTKMIKSSVEEMKRELSDYSIILTESKIDHIGILGWSLTSNIHNPELYVDNPALNCRVKLNKITIKSNLISGAVDVELPNEIKAYVKSGDRKNEWILRNKNKKNIAIKMLFNNLLTFSSSNHHLRDINFQEGDLKILKNHNTIGGVKSAQVIMKEINERDAMVKINFQDITSEIGYHELFSQYPIMEEYAKKYNKNLKGQKPVLNSAIELIKSKEDKSKDISEDKSVLDLSNLKQKSNTKKSKSGSRSKREIHSVLNIDEDKVTNFTIKQIKYGSDFFYINANGSFSILGFKPQELDVSVEINDYKAAIDFFTSALNTIISEVGYKKYLIQRDTIEAIKRTVGDKLNPDIDELNLEITKKDPSQDIRVSGYTMKELNNFVSTFRIKEMNSKKEG